MNRFIAFFTGTAMITLKKFICKETSSLKWLRLSNAIITAWLEERERKKCALRQWTINRYIHTNVCFREIYIGIWFNVSRCKSMTREKSKNAFVFFSFFYLFFLHACNNIIIRTTHHYTQTRSIRKALFTTKKICVDINKYQKLIMRLVNAINVAKQANDDDHRSNEFTARTRPFFFNVKTNNNNNNDRLLAANIMWKLKICVFIYR